MGSHSLAGGFTLAGPADANLDAVRHHAGIGYGVSGLVDIGQYIDIGLSAGSTNMAAVASIGLLCDLSKLEA